jgi:hypothetical protein
MSSSCSSSLLSDLNARCAGDNCSLSGISAIASCLLDPSARADLGSASVTPTAAATGNAVTTEARARWNCDTSIHPAFVMVSPPKRCFVTFDTLIFL